MGNYTPDEWYYVKNEQGYEIYANYGPLDGPLDKDHHYHVASVHVFYDDKNRPSSGNAFAIAMVPTMIHEIEKLADRCAVLGGDDDAQVTEARSLIKTINYNPNNGDGNTGPA